MEYSVVSCVPHETVFIDEGQREVKGASWCLFVVSVLPPVCNCKNSPRLNKRDDRTRGNKKVLNLGLWKKMLL